MDYKTSPQKEKGAVGNRRVALKPHAAKIRRWVEEGRNDDWIAQELNTTPSSVQSFRSRNSIYRRDPVRRGQLSEHPAILDLVEGGIVLRTDASDSEVFDREWRSYVQGAPDDLQVVITQDRIYLEKTR
jgi:DNA-binding CsgD family transcriptional regulator